MWWYYRDMKQNIEKRIRELEVLYASVIALSTKLKGDEVQLSANKAQYILGQMDALTSVLKLLE